MSFPHLPKIDTSQIDFARVKSGAAGAGNWISRTIESLCNRPDHLQRLAIVAAGCVMYPTVWGLILIVWKGFGDHPTLYPQQLQILGWALLGSMVLWGLVVVALLGIVKGIKVEGPGGVGIELTTTSSTSPDDAGAPLQQTTVTTATATAVPTAPVGSDPPAAPAGKPPPEVSD
jgi:hypothetical protein